MAADGSQREPASVQTSCPARGCPLPCREPSNRRTDAHGCADPHPGPNDRLRTFNPDFGSCIHRTTASKLRSQSGYMGQDHRSSDGMRISIPPAGAAPGRGRRTIDDSRRDRDGRDSARRPETCVRGGFAAGRAICNGVTRWRERRRGALRRAGRGCPVWRLRRCDRGRARSASGWAGPASFQERAPGTRPFGIGSRRTKSGSHGIPGSKPYENLRPFDLKDCR